ncbi:glycosyltransferase family 39 protein [Tibeticola sp.]|uniref:ArnT family glycosyltransferase n=1 Tax=Tibeticola sp. TaxID=2005368 RepID=UPI00258CA5D0|nr:glycosyltransferase family 39 protein [Tibeticola sp.]MCI4441500.1 glycosyltransferase family 39 protein [Tibeticola sp.]
MTDQRLERRRTGWLLAGLWGLLLVLAALRPLAVPDEGRYAEVGRWMLQSGDWLTPRLNGLPFFHKPPLLHWLQAASMAVFGENAWAARLVPALHAGLMLLGVYLASRALAPALAPKASAEAFARRAALMFGTSLAFLLGGQYVNHDMLVAAWIATAIWLFAFAFLHGERPHAGLARLGFVACALGVLGKGLIGVVLPGGVIFFWLLATGQWRKMPRLPWFSGLALFALVAVPWFVLEQRLYPGLFDYLFGDQQFRRYTAGGFNNAHPWWFYGVALLALFFPWLFWVFFAAKPGVKPSSVATENKAFQIWLLCLIWVGLIVGFFSIPRSKLVGYVLPVLPPLALLATLGWERMFGARAGAPRLLAALCLAGVALAAVLEPLSTRLTRDKRADDLAQTLACAASPEDTVYVLGGYPYDLPFYVRTPKPFVVLQDWPALRRTAGDNWARELFEAGDFEPATAAQVLQSPEVLPDAARRPGQWLLVPHDHPDGDWKHGWVLVQRGRAWSLYRSAPERPVAAEHESLRGCHR